MITLNNKISVFHWKKKKYFKSGLSEAATRGALLKKSVLKNFANHTGKHLCWSLFLIKLQAYNFIKKRLQHLFSSEICEIFNNIYFEEHLRVVASKFCLLMPL